MSEKVRDELLERALQAEEQVRYWRERCRRMEGMYERADMATASVKAATERLAMMIDHIRPKGTDPKP